VAGVEVLPTCPSTVALDGVIPALSDRGELEPVSSVGNGLGSARSKQRHRLVARLLVDQFVCNFIIIF
jgi:hypothetical protein